MRVPLPILPVAIALCLLGVAPLAAPRAVHCTTLPLLVAQTAALSPGDTLLETRLRTLFSEWRSTPPARAAAAVPAIRDKIDEAVTAHVAALLARRPPPDHVQHDLDEALALAAWESAFGLSQNAAKAALRSNPQHLAFVVRGPGSPAGFYAVAFSIGYGNVFSTRIHAFRYDERAYRPLRTVGELQGKVEGIVRLQNFAPGEFRFVVWSLHVGSPEALTTVVLYKLDKSGVQTLYSRPDLAAARVFIHNGLVVIESHHPVRTRTATVTEYESRFYRQTRAGLKLVKTERRSEC